jgi:uncharacterized Zn finger protein
MNLTITCPQCGYNQYKALNTKTNKEITIIISKCETTACELEIPEDEVFNTFNRQEDLCLPSRYVLISQTLSDCFGDDSLN